MADERTRAYFRAVANAQEANKKAIDAAQEICTCADCTKARELKSMNETLSACQQAKIINTIRDSVIGRMPGHYSFELSPNYFDNKSRVTSRRAF